MSSQNLPRVTGKIFASNAPIDEIGQFGSAVSGTKVTTSSIEDIQALPAFEEGWGSAVVPNRNFPTLQEMNGLQKVFSQQIAYLLQKGIPEWDEGTTYFPNSICQIQGVIYKSLTPDNIGNEPTSEDTTDWERYELGGSGYANIDLNNLSEAGEARLNEYVQKSGDTMTNSLFVEFEHGQSGYAYNIKQPDFEYGVDIPSSNIYNSYRFVDKNNNDIGGLQLRTDTNGATALSLTLKNPKTDNYAGLYIQGNADGTWTTQGYTPAISSNNTEIATTAFVKSVLSSFSGSWAANFGPSITPSSGWTATSAGILYMNGFSDSNSGNKFEVSVGGQIVYSNTQTGSNANHHNIGSSVLVQKGQVITYTGSARNTISFYPYA